MKTTQKLIRHISLVLIVLFGAVGCSDSKDKEEAVLTVDIEKVNFKADVGLTKTVKVTTNSTEWNASVESSGKDWCFIKKEIGNLVIEVDENKNGDKRSTKIAVQAGTLKLHIEVEQLGYNKDILVSEEFINLKPTSTSFKIIVTSNTEYNFTPPEWITEVVEDTRVPEMVDKEHEFYVTANDKDEKRTNNLVVQSEDKSIEKIIVITQNGLNSYDGNDTEGVKDDIKIEVVSGEASSFQPNSGVIENSFDGDKNTLYHSNWSNAGKDYFPITLTYNLKANTKAIDYLIYYPRTSGHNGHFKEVDILISTQENEDFVKLSSHDFKGVGTPSKIEFDKTIINPKAVRFVVKSGTGDGQGFASCAEMEFYRKNPDTFDYTTLFTDETCSELKPTVTEKEIEDCDYPFYKNLAFYLFHDKYDTEFRVQEYKAFPNPDDESKLNKTSSYSLMDNPTGISIKANEEVIIFAGDTHGQQVSVRLQNLDKPGGDGYGGPSFPISKGVNKFIAPAKGLLYVMYHTPDYKTLEPIKIHIATGSVNGYFDSQKHTKEDWNRLLNHTTDSYFDVLGKYAHLTFPVSIFKKNTPDGLALIDTFDEIVRLEMDFMGLFKYDRVFGNRMYLHVIYQSYMYATSYRTAYNVSTLDALCNVSNLKTGGIWGPAHEIGHVNQTRPGLLWLGTTEVTNNIHSMYVQTTFGNVSRLQGEDLGNGVNRYEKAMDNTFTNQIAHAQEEDVFCKLVPFWQIQLYVSDVLGKEDVYKDIYEHVRVNPDLKTPGENQLEFVYRASKASGLDLTDFFRKWGFLKPVDVEIDDYGKGRLVVTEAQANKVVERVKALGLPKPSAAFEYITDNTVEVYKKNQNIGKGTATISGNTITTSGWTNVVAYEVYINDKLTYVSPNSKFTVKNGLGDKYKVYAISAKGDRVEVSF